MATTPITLTATATSAVTLSNPVSLDELQLLGTPTINIDASATVDGLVGLEEGYYIMVEPTTTPTTNGTRLLAAYTDAKALSGISASKRAVVLLPPAEYDLGGTTLTMDTQYVDIMGLSKDPRSTIITNGAGAVIALNTTNANLKGLWCFGRLDATGEDITCQIECCIFGVQSTTNALAGNATTTCSWKDCLFYEVGRASNISTIGGVCDRCVFEGADTLYVASGTVMRYCTIEVTLDAAAGSTDAKIYLCALKAALGSNITNAIGTTMADGLQTALNVVDSDIAI